MHTMLLSQCPIVEPSQLTWDRDGKEAVYFVAESSAGCAGVDMDHILLEIKDHHSSMSEVLDQRDSELVLGEPVPKQTRLGIRLRPVKGQWHASSTSMRIIELGHVVDVSVGPGCSLPNYLLSTAHGIKRISPSRGHV